MKIKSHTTRFLIFGGLGIILIFSTVLIRLINLKSLPIFADEAIYVRWSQIMLAEPNLRFLPLSDGKQPLFMWITIPFLKLFSDPLFAGRFVSVLSSAVSVFGIMALSFVLFKSKKASLFSGFLYMISPFSFFFDRLSVVDSMLSAIGVIFLLTLSLAIQYMRWDFALISGMTLGAMFLTKSPALFFLLLIPSSALLSLKKIFKKPLYFSLPYTLFLFGTVATLAIAISQLLRLGPNYRQLASRSLDYVFPVSHILTSPKDPFLFYLDRAIEWIVMMGPWPLLLLAFLGVITNIQGKVGRIMFLLIYFAVPLLIVTQFAKVFTARYILFILPSLYVMAGLFVINQKRNLVSLFLISLMVITSVPFLYQLITDPEKAPLPKGERSGYLEEWTAGQGLYEISRYIRNVASENPNQAIVVGTEGFFGTLPDGLQIYLEKVPKVLVIGVGLNFKEVPSSLRESAQFGNKTYFVVNKSRLKFESKFEDNNLKLINTYLKAVRRTDSHEYFDFGPQEELMFFEVLPINEN